MNKLLPLIAFSILFLVPLGTSQAQAALVSHYEAEGDYTDSADGNNGTPVNEDGPAFATGQIGLQGFDMDGINDHILLGNPANLNFGNGDYSISSWVSTTFTGGTPGFNDFIISKTSSGPDGQYVLTTQNGGGNALARFGINTAASPDFASAISPCSIADGTFHHVVGVRQGTDIELYLDGVLVDTDSSSGIITATSANQVIIGGRQNAGNDPYFNGIIDDVKFFNHALSPAEVQTLATGSSLPNGCLDTDGDFIEDSIDECPFDPLNQCNDPPIQTIGGEIIPIEQTSLILAGAQSFSWMLPLVLSVVGIAIFVVSRKN